MMRAAGFPPAAAPYFFFFFGFAQPFFRTGLGGAFFDSVRFCGLSVEGPPLSGLTRQCLP